MRPSVVINRAEDGGWFASLFGKRSRIALHSEQFLGRLSQLEVLVGAEERASAMRHLGAQLVLNVVAGSLLLRVEGAPEMRLRQGATAIIPPGADHQWRGDGACARALLTFSPGGIEAMLHACANLAPDEQRYLSRTFGTEILSIGSGG